MITCHHEQTIQMRFSGTLFSMNSALIRCLFADGTNLKSFGNNLYKTSITKETSLFPATETSLRKEKIKNIFPDGVHKTVNELAG